MERIVEATYDGEVFRPDEPVDLASDTKVKVIIEDMPQNGKRLQLVEMPKKAVGKPYAWLDFAQSANLEGPSDFSTNLDDYLNGTKSLDDAE
ncbi:MAG: antitoxin family protein [Pyrinomonadaceae bacterium]